MMAADRGRTAASDHLHLDNRTPRLRRGYRGRQGIQALTAAIDGCLSHCLSQREANCHLTNGTNHRETGQATQSGCGGLSTGTDHPISANDNCASAGQAQSSRPVIYPLTSTTANKMASLTELISQLIAEVDTTLATFKDLRDRLPDSEWDRMCDHELLGPLLDSLSDLEYTVDP